MQTPRLTRVIPFVVAYILICVAAWATLPWPVADLVCVVIAIAGIGQWNRQPAMGAGETPTPTEEGKDPIVPNLLDMPPPDVSALTNDILRRDLALAAEHLQSIRWLLEIARAHQQPIPTGVLKNLELVSKQLCRMRQRMDIAGEEIAPEWEISPVVRRP